MPLWKLTILLRSKLDSLMSNKQISTNFFLLLILFYSVYDFCSKSFDSYSRKYETNIYSTVIDYSFFRLPYSYVLVGDSTSLLILNYFNFKNVKDNGFDGKSISKLSNTSWKYFLASIDINISKNFGIDSKFTSNINVKLRPLVKNYYKEKESDLIWPLQNNNYKLPKHSLTGGLLIFSPVILSNDGTKAVCAMNIYQGPEDSSTTMYFLERNKNMSWKVVSTILYSIS